MQKMSNSPEIEMHSVESNDWKSKAKTFQVCVCFVKLLEASCYVHKQNAPP